VAAYTAAMREPILVGGQPTPIMDTLQAELIEQTEAADGQAARAVLRFPVLPEYTNPMGQLQGGMYAVMMDSAMAVAAGGIGTATLQVSILRPATAGFLIVSGEIVRRGRRIIYAEGEVRDEAGLLIARGNQTGVPRE
jgi:uncharacterized protein (TIGR00369 family)